MDEHVYNGEDNQRPDARHQNDVENNSVPVGQECLGGGRVTDHDVSLHCHAQNAERMEEVAPHSDVAN